MEANLFIVRYFLLGLTVLTASSFSFAEGGKISPKSSPPPSSAGKDSVGTAQPLSGSSAGGSDGSSLPPKGDTSGLGSLPPFAKDVGGTAQPLSGFSTGGSTGSSLPPSSTPPSVDSPADRASARRATDARSEGEEARAEETWQRARKIAEDVRELQRQRAVKEAAGSHEVEAEKQKYRKQIEEIQAEIERARTAASKIRGTRRAEIDAAILKVQADLEEASRKLKATKAQAKAEREEREKSDRARARETEKGVEACDLDKDQVAEKLWKGDGILAWQKVLDLLKEHPDCNRHRGYTISPESNPFQFYELRASLAFNVPTELGTGRRPDFATPILDLPPDIRKLIASLPVSPFSEIMNQIDVEMSAFYGEAPGLPGSQGWNARQKNVQKIKALLEEIQEKTRNTVLKNKIGTFLRSYINPMVDIKSSDCEKSFAEFATQPNVRQYLTPCNTLEHPSISDLNAPDVLAAIPGAKLCPDRAVLISFANNPTYQTSEGACAPRANTKRKPNIPAYSTVCAVQKALKDCAGEDKIPPPEKEKAPKIPKPEIDKGLSGAPSRDDQRSGSERRGPKDIPADEPMEEAGKPDDPGSKKSGRGS